MSAHICPVTGVHVCIHMNRHMHMFYSHTHLTQIRTHVHMLLCVWLCICVAVHVCTYTVVCTEKHVLLLMQSTFLFPDPVGGVAFPVPPSLFLSHCDLQEAP